MRNPFRYFNGSPEVIRPATTTPSGRGFVTIDGKTHFPWRAVEYEGEVLEVFATKRRDRRAALKFLKRTMKRYGRPKTIVTDRCRAQKLNPPHFP